jgi:predicted kinase
MTTIELPRLALVLLIGTSGSGKSVFAARHFKSTEVLSSDVFRGLVGDDENDQSVTAEAFEALRAVASKRLELGRMTVVDATNLQSEARGPLLRLARDHRARAFAIVLDVPEAVCLERNRERLDRYVSSPVVRRQRAALRRSLERLEREDFDRVVVLRGVEEIDAVEIVRGEARTGGG